MRADSFNFRSSWWVLGALLMLAGRSQAAVFTSELITNLTTGAGAACSSDPSQGVAMGGYFYFAASDGTNGSTGRELWRTDGTAAGTTLVKDIRPGAAGSSPERLVAAGTNIYFVADDGIHGKELWRSDGTGVGTYMVSDVTSGTGDPFIWPHASGDAAYFSAGPGLFRTDGTRTGLVRLAGPGGVVSTNRCGLFDVNGLDVVLETEAAPSSSGPQTNTLWRFTGTGPFYYFSLQTLPYEINWLAVVGNSCCFVISSNYPVVSLGITNYYSLQKLLRISFSGGPVEELDSSAPAAVYSDVTGLQVANGRLYYSWSSFDYSQGYRYGAFKTVGDTGAPVQIEPAPAGAHPIVAVEGGYVYYSQANYNIYKTDGFSPGVQVVTYNLPDYPQSFVQAGSLLFIFMIYKPLGFADLAQGTVGIVSNSVPGTNGRIAAIMGALGQAVFYAEDDGQIGSELHYSDGTTNGTFLVKDIAAGNQALPPLEAVVAGGLLFYTLPTSSSAAELWRSDGTVAGTLRLKADLVIDTYWGVTNRLTACGDLLFFATANGTNGNELWRSDGTVSGTFMVKDIRPGAAGSNPSELTAAGTNLFFAADDGLHGSELWRSDGTEGGTFLVQDLTPGLGSGNIHAMTGTGTRVHFLAGPDSTSGNLWYSTGEPGGTQFLLTFATNSWVGHFTPFANKTYFSVWASSFYLWSTDDTPGGTTPIANIGNELAIAGGVLYGTALAPYPTSRLQLWKSDGTSSGTILFQDLPALQLTTLGTNLYFTVNSDLWVSDGTTNGTVPVAAFSFSSERPANLTAFQNTLLFTAWTPALGREFWSVAPGQAAAVVEDLSPQSGDAGIQFVGAGTNRVFYIAHPSGQSRWQLRSLRLQSLAPPAQGPFGGVPWPVPGRIEAEDFDVGGEGQAYHDLTADNGGGQYRPAEGVDIEECNDTGGGFCLFQTRADEWVEYTIEAAADAMYQLDVRLTSQIVNTGFFRFELDGGYLSEYAVLNDGNPGGWFTEYTTVPISRGRHVLRLYFESPTSAGDVGLINWFNFSLVQSNVAPVVSVPFPPNGGIISTSLPVVLQARVDDTTTAAPPQVQFFVDGQSAGSVASPPYSLPWTPTPGPHTLYVTAVDSFGALGSSSNILFFVGEPILPTRSFWNYNPFGTNLPSSWTRLGYNDSTWGRSRSPIGYGYTDLASVIPGIFTNSLTFFFRGAFSNNLSTFNFASLTLTRDDGAVVYVNGQQLARVNMPDTGFISVTNLALTNVVNTAARTNAAVDVIPVPLSMLIDGTNLIAVEVHQGFPLHDPDLKFDLTFSTVYYTPPPVLTIEWLSNAVAVRWPDNLAGWTLEQSTNLANWTTNSSSISDTGGFFTLLLSPPLSKQQFYRLHQTSP